MSARLPLRVGRVTTDPDRFLDALLWLLAVAPERPVFSHTIVRVPSGAIMAAPVEHTHAAGLPSAAHVYTVTRPAAA